MTNVIGAGLQDVKGVANRRTGLSGALVGNAA